MSVGSLAQEFKGLGVSEVLGEYVMTHRELMREVRVIKNLGSGVAGVASLVTYRGQRACMKTGHACGAPNLLQEAEILLKVAGAGGAPRLYAVCRDEPVLIMEYIEGQTFLEFCSGASFTDREYVKADIMRKLKELHSAGFVHNDVHEANVIVCGTPGHYSARLIDLGYAREATEPQVRLDRIRAGMIGSYL